MKASSRATVAQLREDVAKFREMIAQRELNAAIPHADCREPTLFAEQELRFAEQYKLIVSELLEEISRREGQLVLQFPQNAEAVSCAAHVR